MGPRVKIASWCWNTGGCSGIISTLPMLYRILVLEYWRVQRGEIHPPDPVWHRRAGLLAGAAGSFPPSRCCTAPCCWDTRGCSGIISVSTLPMLYGILALEYWRVQRDNFHPPDAVLQPSAGIIRGRAGIISVSLLYWPARRDNSGPRWDNFRVAGLLASAAG